MADLSSKDDPLHLRDERPDYVEDKSGMGNEAGGDDDLSEEQAPEMNRVEDVGSLGVDKPHVTLDEDAVRKAESEGKGYQ